MKINGQQDRLKQRLDAGYPVTSLDAFRRLCIVHLPGVVRDLKRDQNYRITSEWLKIKNRYGEPGKVKVYRKFVSLEVLP